MTTSSVVGTKCASELPVFLEKARQQLAQKHKEMKAARDTKRNAYRERRRTWHDWKAIQHANTYEVSGIIAEAAELQAAEKKLREAADEAFRQGKFSTARNLSAEGRILQARRKQMLRDCDLLIDEVRSASAQHNSACRAYDRAKANHAVAHQAFIQARSDFDKLMAVHRLATGEGLIR